LNRSRVLLADDHLAMLEVEIALLAPYFDVVGTAGDGAALVSKARSLHPDIIVTDISMPILSGVDAVQRIKESGSNAIFVFVTVHSEREFVEAGMKAGALGYVQKSCMRRHLLPAIQAALAGEPYVSLFDSSWRVNRGE
jgi:DNA-binding NarL/FixJ family response regulator